MTGIHVKRDFSNHRKSVVRPYDEYCGLEIFSYDPRDTRVYNTNSLKTTSNCKKSSWMSLSCFISDNKIDDMVFDVEYKSLTDSEYRIDFLYEQSNHLYGGSKSDKTYDTGKDLAGHITVGDIDEDVLFDGENNILKRIPVYTYLDVGVHNIHVEVPQNCYFYGIIVRRIVKFNVNNYFGSDAGKDSGNMMLTTATLNIANMIKPAELQCSVGYDSSFECEDSPSGLYIDYKNEVNFYVKDLEGKIQRVFGGYVSSVLPNANRTELTIYCADRLVDGENKYVLDEMNLLGGTTGSEEEDYSERMTKNFINYAHALKYLCDIHEVTLKSNISTNYLVEGEKYSQGFAITYGKNKTIKKIPVSNGQSTSSKNFITLRNNPDGSKKQVWTLYDASKQGKVAPNITGRGYIHITYGLGSPKTEVKTKTTETVDVSDSTAGVQKFGKCGVSHDKKYIMAIGQPSGAKGTKGYNYHTIYKTIFENKCPHCGGSLRWDSGRSDTNCIYCGGYHGSKRTWGNISETEITCTKCCADYDSVTGYEKDAPWKKLKKVSKTVKSSKAEQNKLHQGKMTAIPKTGVEIVPDDIFKAITKEAFKYKYVRGATGQTYNQMKKTGHGDCWGFSDLIFTFLKKYGVTCKVVSYSTGSSDSHHSVLYKNSKNEWVDFPYREYGWNTKYHNQLNNTSKSKHASTVASFKGTNIGNVKVKSKTTTKTQTTTVTTTKGYDKTKPFQGLLKITYSNTNSLKAPKKTLYLKFTLSTTNGESINGKAFPLYWVNNTTKKATLVDNDYKSLNIVDFIHTVHNSNEEVYLQSIQMITPKKEVTDSNDANWYTYNKTTHDESSCKIDLYQITFDNDKGLNSAELSSCGKTVNSMLQELVDDTGYIVNMTYGLHRKDDVINFRVDNTTLVSYTASEGDDNNILSWNSINYSPVSSLFNSSVQVFKQDDNKYYYVNTRNPDSIFNYGEQITLKTSNEPISQSEAYFNARMNPKFNSEQTYTYTITVPYAPFLRLGDLVTVIANAKKLNSVKEILSLKLMFDWKKMPRLRTEIGLGELAPDIQLMENIRKLRKDVKKESTNFTGSAIAVTKNEVYEWDV